MSRRTLVCAFASLVTSAFAVAACSASSPADIPPGEDGGGTVITGSDGGVTIETGTVDAPATPCGNGKVDTGEACDDGNKTSGDGCSATCTLESAFEGDACPG